MSVIEKAKEATKELTINAVDAILISQSLLEAVKVINDIRNKTMVWPRAEAPQRLREVHEKSRAFLKRIEADQ
jgi:hypothetical protein